MTQGLKLKLLLNWLCEIVVLIPPAAQITSYNFS